MNNNNNNRIYAGIFGGLCESVIMQPIDTIKVLRQSNQYNGLFNHINKNGVRSLYKGLSPFMFQMGVKYAYRFTVFEKFKGDGNNKLRNFCAGGFAGISESTFITPFELIKTNLQTTKQKNPLIAVKNIYNQGGIKNLYRGFGTTCIRQSMNQALNFTVYQEIRKKIIKENERPNIFKVMTAGFFSGSLGPILNNPFDVIKTRYMNPKYNKEYDSIVDAGRKIIKYEGISTLYKGLGLRIIRVAGGQGIVFYTVESLMYHFNNH
jgi:solute carrier family 25 (mitochondrial citrate transporter), member 1